MPVGPFFVDFMCRSHKIAIEIDGLSHDVQPERDVLRDQYLRDAGFRVLHFSNEDVMTNTEGVVEMIAGVLLEQPTPGPSREREGRS